MAFLYCCSSLQAQPPVPLNEPDLKKPRLFNSLPDRVPVESTLLKSLISGSEGSSIQLPMGKTSLEGTIISTSFKYNNIRSVLIRSSNFNGASMTLSSSTTPDGTVKISGRILSMQHGDLFELHNEKGTYVFVRKEFYDVINE